MRQIKVTNTLTGRKEPLETVTPGRLTMYSCGPTVYGLIHIGNLRAALVADMFYRYFMRAGYEVVFVRNYTDVDDKIIKKALEEKTTADAVALKYTAEVEKDYKSADMLEPTHKPAVTGHMPEIIALVRKIIDNGKAYVVDGEVFFSIDAFPEYGKLSHKNLEDLEAGRRVDVNDKKRNPMDFSLWKPAKPGEPSWDSPWSRGRPGWHIECSAMSSRWIGDRIDVHHGGEDLVFPHHENEIAQSEAASGVRPFVRYWMHSAFLTLAKEKMSKSLGNVFLARDFLARFGAAVARYMLLGVHYRSMIDFNDDTLEQALTGIQRIYEAKAKALAMAGVGTAGPWNDFVSACDRTAAEMDDHFANDFNTPGALGALFTLIREFNRLAALQPSGAGVDAGKRLVRLIEHDLGGVLGVGLGDPASMLKELDRIRAERLGGAGGRMSVEEIQKLIDARTAARAARDFAEADRLRKELDSRGIVIKDSKDGTAWSYK